MSIAFRPSIEQFSHHLVNFEKCSAFKHQLLISVILCCPYGYVVIIHRSFDRDLIAWSFCKGRIDTPYTHLVTLNKYKFNLFYVHLFREIFGGRLNLILIGCWPLSINWNYGYKDDILTAYTRRPSHSLFRSHQTDFCNEKFVCTCMNLYDLIYAGLHYVHHLLYRFHYHLIYRMLISLAHAVLLF